MSVVQFFPKSVPFGNNIFAMYVRRRRGTNNFVKYIIGKSLKNK